MSAAVPAARATPIEVRDMHRPRLLAFTLIIASCFAGVAGAQQTPVGRWKQFDDRQGDLRSIIRIDLVGDQLVGSIVQTFLRPGEPADPVCDKCPGDFKDRPIVGLRFMWGLTGRGRAWDGGRVLDPDDGRIYKVKLRLSEDGRTLDVRGYVGISLLGRTQRWIRDVE